jgi:UDP-2,3-diacylglucosamine hydrolase
MQRTLFISDLHLDPGRPETTARFERFLDREASQAEALYILGDLFEAWVGDDSLSLDFNAAIAGWLKRVAHTTRVCFMQGNRDFLAGAGFLAATGASPLTDPTLIDLYGTRALLMHGDTLCTGDTAYQTFRAQSRDPRWQAAALSQPLQKRLAIARGMRADSEAAKAGKSEAIMDVADDAVAQAFRDSGCQLLIHGHTHRPARHESRVDGAPCVRWVLPDWYGVGARWKPRRPA